MNKYGQIYKITNKINNKVYIGLTIQNDVLNDRYKGNLLSTHNQHLKFSISKYGIENFCIETIYWANSKEELVSKEKEYIALYNSTNENKGYNKHEGGIGGRPSDESIVIISEKSKQMWDSRPDMRLSLINRNINNPLIHTNESKTKISATRKERIANGQIDISKALDMIHHDPIILRKRVESYSKTWCIQYDCDFNELRKWHTIKDMYDYMIEIGVENNISYGGFKLTKRLNKVFGDDLYKGFYWRKVNKLQYANTEVN
ncbi:TPA: hypothetical protein DD450_04695 [Candidatus Woesebacteria bacterium]|nr:hypothetical protein [Candidatus Woesebacteria bacterium]